MDETINSSVLQPPKSVSMMTSCCKGPSCTLEDSCDNSRCVVACCHSRVIIQAIDSQPRGKVNQPKKGEKFPWSWCCCWWKSALSKHGKKRS